MAQLDHFILFVNDRDQSIEFYSKLLGFGYEGEREGTPFSMIRVDSNFAIQLSPFGTKGGEHLAFSMDSDEFERTFKRVRESEIPYGDNFDTVGNLHGPGDSGGAKGNCKSIYFFDPNRHLIEILRY